MTIDTFKYLNSLKKQELQVINESLYKLTGINNFFESKQELLSVLTSDNYKTRQDIEQKEFGDFQTNLSLAKQICDKLKNKNLDPKTIIEPTSGTGNFIIAALQTFNPENIYAVEIFKPYILEAKLKILSYYLTIQQQPQANITFFHHNVFTFNWKKLNIKKPILILGNPPWITNSQLGQMNSKNLPSKSNFQKLNGIQAITGKSNFDISEYITISLLKQFQQTDGYIAFILKNSVIRKLIYNQKNQPYKIGDLNSYPIDANSEFNASVSASIFIAKLNSPPELTCKEIHLSSEKVLNEFGWKNSRFIANLKLYRKVQYIDGNSQLIWRQGIKHDAAKILELKKNKSSLTNKFNQTVDIEQERLFPLIKGKQLKGQIIDSTDNYLILPHLSVNENLAIIQHQYPKLYNYLLQNISHFTKRKSKIYKNKSPFAIFGIGQYSFKPFKVAIYGLAKQINFSLILPIDNKPVLLDDTSYFLSFDNYEFAYITYLLLNISDTKTFLTSISFKDSKRVITKDILQRIDLLKLLQKHKDSLDLPQSAINDYQKFLTKNIYAETQKLLWV